MIMPVTGQSRAVERTQKSLQKAVGGQLVAVGEIKIRVERWAGPTDIVSYWSC